MLDGFGATEENWREVIGHRPHFCISESPRFAGRAVAALASDADVARWSGQALSSGGLARIYGFTDVDGSRPDRRRCTSEVQDTGRPVDATGTGDSDSVRGFRSTFRRGWG